MSDNPPDRDISRVVFVPGEVEQLFLMKFTDNELLLDDRHHQIILTGFERWPSTQWSLCW